MNYIKKILEKAKSVKHIEIYVACVLAIAILLLVILSSSKKTEKVAVDESYISQMEHKIVSVVENIEGCGKASVAISYKSADEKVYAYETQTSSAGGKVTQSSNIVTVKGEPLVLKTLPPNILGVVVVAEGADNPVLKFKIIQVVVTLLGVDSSNVQVFTYKS